MLYGEPLNKYSIDSKALALLILSFIGKCEAGHKGRLLLSMSCALMVSYIINQILTLIATLCSHVRVIQLEILS